MTDHSLARSDEVLTELIDMVETARTMPMSSSCVVPRERTLDLLDALREVLPTEIAEARTIVSQRDRMLADAQAHADEAVRTATERADVLLADARAQADVLIADAQAQAHQLVTEGQAEQARLVEATAVHQRATADAQAVLADAEAHVTRVRAEADDYAASTRVNAEHHAAQLTADTHGYADRTLAELVANLQKLASTAENGRVALARRGQSLSGGAGAGAHAAVEDDFLQESGLR